MWVSTLVMPTMTSLASSTHRSATGRPTTRRSPGSPPRAASAAERLADEDDGAADVQRPPDAEHRRDEDPRRVGVPQPLAQSRQGRHAEVVRDEPDASVPGTVLPREPELLYDGGRHDAEAE